jgi:hypothetical protein
MKAALQLAGQDSQAVKAPRHAGSLSRGHGWQPSRGTYSGHLGSCSNLARRQLNMRLPAGPIEIRGVETTPSPKAHPGELQSAASHACRDRVVNKNEGRGRETFVKGVRWELKTGLERRVGTPWGTRHVHPRDTSIDPKLRFWFKS